MKVYSTHFVLKGKSDYKDLAPIFPEILKEFLTDIGQMPEEEEIFQMFVQLNLNDLELNRKPEGYNRKGKMRLIFPTDRKEFYLIAYSKATDIAKVADTIGMILTRGGVAFDTLQNDRVTYD